MATSVLPRVLTTAGAHRLGITDAGIRTELRRGRWRRLGPGLLLTRPDEPTRDDWIVAGLVLGGPGAVLSGWDAVHLRAIGATHPPDPLVLVLATAGRNRCCGGVHIRPSRRALSSSVISTLDDRLPGTRLAAAPRAIADTAWQHDRLLPVRAMVTAAIQRGLCTPTELADELAAGPRNGSGHLRRALLDLGPAGPAHSVAEAHAVDWLRRGGVDGFEVNAAIHGLDGRLLYRVDLLWRQLRAIVEIDSREFHFGEREWRATMRRHNALTTLDYAVAHYPPSAIREGGLSWAHEVARWLDRRAAALSA